MTNDLTQEDLSRLNEEPPPDDAVGMPFLGTVTVGGNIAPICRFDLDEKADERIGVLNRYTAALMEHGPVAFEAISAVVPMLGDDLIAAHFEAIERHEHPVLISPGLGDEILIQKLDRDPSVADHSDIDQDEDRSCYISSKTTVDMALRTVEFSCDLMYWRGPGSTIVAYLKGESLVWLAA